MRSSTPAAALVLGLILAGCGGVSPSRPTGTQALVLTATASAPVVPAGVSATLTFRLENTGTETIELSFPTACQITPYIATRAGSVIYPGGGAWACAQVLTSLTLPPGGSKVESLRIVGGLGPLSSAYGLPAGDYVAYARVEARGRVLESYRVAFTVL